MSHYKDPYKPTRTLWENHWWVLIAAHMGPVFFLFVEGDFLRILPCWIIIFHHHLGEYVLLFQVSYASLRIGGIKQI